MYSCAWSFKIKKQTNIDTKYYIHIQEWQRYKIVHMFYFSFDIYSSFILKKLAQKYLSSSLYFCQNLLCHSTRTPDGSTNYLAQLTKWNWRLLFQISSSGTHYEASYKTQHWISTKKDIFTIFSIHINASSPKSARVAWNGKSLCPALNCNRLLRMMMN